MYNSRRRGGLDVLLVFILTFSVLLFLGLEYRQTKQALLKIQIDFERQKSKGKDEVYNESVSTQGQSNDKTVDDGISSTVFAGRNEANQHIQVKMMERVDKGSAMDLNKKVNLTTVSTQATKDERLPDLAQNDRDTTVKENLIDCPEKPKLMGHIAVNTDPDAAKPAELNEVKFGGWWSPGHCKARVKVAILVPLRNRPTQLQVFLRHITPVLQRQLLHYRIFVIEQVGKVAFNKGAIYNIGFNETLRYDDYDCYIFHDVDLLTENDHNYYGCPSSPLHMSVAIDKFKYRLPYPNIFGGIQAIKKDHYVTLNGYSNKYWGWGAEDDDLYRRVKDAKLAVHRPGVNIARYKMNKEYHFTKKIDNSVWRARNIGLLYYRPIKSKNEGLNSISTLSYTKSIVEHNLYTNITIDLAFDEGG